jgi:glycosyltransferase involved in cell wall biosynthesis
MSVTYVNGKFTVQRPTGVQRAATELLLALDREPTLTPGDWVLLCPPDAAAPPLRRIEVRTVGWRGVPLHAWEQLCLPWHARGGRLLNLAGSASALARAPICMFHDAAVFDVPWAYRRGFVAWYRALFRWLGRVRRARLLTVSAFSRERLAQVLGVGAQHIHVVPLAGEHVRRVAPRTEVLGRLQLRQGGFLLTVATANPTKNLDALCEAAGTLDQPGDPLLVLVGGGNARVFASGAEGRARADRVRRAGVVDDGELRALYESALALVIPSLYEGFGVPALEAMVCGCPVLAAERAALPEVCADAALYFDPLSTASITRALRRIAEDDALRDGLRARGLRRAGQFAWQVSALQLMAAIGEADE